MYKLGNGSVARLGALPARKSPALDSLASSDDSAVWISGYGHTKYTGTDGDDSYGGTQYRDSARGLSGNDMLSGGDGADTLHGNSGNDILSGDDGQDVLYGDKGDDMLSGGNGDDDIFSTSGADTIDGGAGDYDYWRGDYTDATQSFAFDDTTGGFSNGTTITNIESVFLTLGYGQDSVSLVGRETYVTVDAGAGTDDLTIDYSSDDNDMLGGLTFQASAAQGSISGTMSRVDDGLARTYIGFSNFESIDLSGSKYNDVFTIDASIVSNHFNVRLDGLDGYDMASLNFSGLMSTSFVAAADGSVTSGDVHLANIEGYTITLGGGTNDVELGSGNDIIDATNGGSNILAGGGGDDQIYVTGGTAAVDGGDGYNDYLYISTSSTTYDEASQKLSTGTNFKNIEDLRLSTTGDSTFYLLGLISTSIQALGARDVVNVDMTSADSGVTLKNSFEDSFSFRSSYVSGAEVINFKATSFNDSFIVTSSLFADEVHLDGGDGNDALTANLVGSDAVHIVVSPDHSVTSSIGEFTSIERFDLTLGSGDNIIVTGDANDIITVGGSSSRQGDNSLQGGNGDDQITGGSGADLIRGGSGDDVLKGGSGDDVLDGGDGKDIIDGGDGVDTATYHFATSAVHVAIMSNLQDTGGAGEDLLASIENLIGSEFDDQLTGSSGDNALRGAGGNDLLDGGGGADILTGGAGKDVLTGGAGTDHFAYIKISDSAKGSGDQITDFSHADKDIIDLSAIDPDSKAAGDQSFTFIGSGTFTRGGSDFELRVEDQGNGSYLVQADVNHDGHSDFNILVTAAAPLTNGDFVL